MIRLQAEVLAGRAEQSHADALELPIQPADCLTKLPRFAWPNVGRQRFAPFAADLEKLLQVRLGIVLGVLAPELGEAALAVRLRPVVGELGLLRQRKKSLCHPVTVGDLFGRDAVILDNEKTGLFQRLADGSHRVLAVGR